MLRLSMLKWAGWFPEVWDEQPEASGPSPSPTTDIKEIIQRSSPSCAAMLLPRARRPSLTLVRDAISVPAVSLQYGFVVSVDGPCRQTCVHRLMWLSPHCSPDGQKHAQESLFTSAFRAEPTLLLTKIDYSACSEFSSPKHPFGVRFLIDPRQPVKFSAPHSLDSQNTHLRR